MAHAFVYDHAFLKSRHNILPNCKKHFLRAENATRFRSTMLLLFTLSTSSSVEIEGTCVSKYFEETVCLQSDKRREWIRQIRGERLQGIAEGASSAPRLASSSAVSFPRRNECPGTHCSLIEHKEKKDSSCQICHRV